ncbi:MAG: phage holin family protein [Janthinobacterium lividum]
MASLQVEPNEAPSIGELLRRLVEDTGHLFRTEIRLAKSELRSNIAAAAGGGMAIGAGAILLLGAVFTLLGAAVGFLTPYVGAGWAALIVAVVAGVIGVILVMSGGKKLSASSLVPDRAVASLKQDADALKGNN